MNIFMSRFVLFVLPVLSEHPSWGVVWLTPAEKLSDVVVDVSIIALENKKNREICAWSAARWSWGCSCPFGLRNGFGGVGEGGENQKNEKKMCLHLVVGKQVANNRKNF